jgi:hypothetical protein
MAAVFLRASQSIPVFQAYQNDQKVLTSREPTYGTLDGSHKRWPAGIVYFRACQRLRARPCSGEESTGSVLSVRHLGGRAWSAASHSMPRSIGQVVTQASRMAVIEDRLQALDR